MAAFHCGIRQYGPHIVCAFVNAPVIILCGYRPRSLVVASVVCEAGLPSSVLVWSGDWLLTVHRAQFSGIVLRSSVFHKLSASFRLLFVFF